MGFCKKRMRADSPTNLRIKSCRINYHDAVAYVRISVVADVGRVGRYSFPVLGVESHAYQKSCYFSGWWEKSEGESRVLKSRKWSRLATAIVLLQVGKKKKHSQGTPAFIRPESCGGRRVRARLHPFFRIHTFPSFLSLFLPPFSFIYKVVAVRDSVARPARSFMSRVRRKRMKTSHISLLYTHNYISTSTLRTQGGCGSESSRHVAS